MKVKGKVCMTILNGNVSMQDGVLSGKPLGEISLLKFKEI